MSSKIQEITLILKKTLSTGRLILLWAILMVVTKDDRAQYKFEQKVKKITITYNIDTEYFPNHLINIIAYTYVLHTHEH